MSRFATPVIPALLCISMFLAGCAGGPEEKEAPGAAGQIKADVLELAKQVMAVAKIELAERDEPLDVPGYDRIESRRKEGVPIEVTGVFVENGKYLLVPEPGIPLDDFGRVTLRTYDGREYEAVPHSFLMDAPGMLLRVKIGEGEAAPAAVAFEGIKPFGFGDAYMSAHLQEDDAVMDVAVVGGAVSHESAEGEKEVGYFGHRALGALVLNGEGKPVGFVMAERMWDTPEGRTTWRGTTLMQMRRITCDEMKKMLEETAETVRKSVIKLEFTYRDEDGEGYGMPGGYSSAPEEVFGLVVDEGGTVFVPRDMDEGTVNRIEDIAFKDEQRVRHLGRFVGLSKNFGGFVVKFDDMPPVPPVRISAAGRMLRAQPFISAHIVEKRGKTTVIARFNRVSRADRIEKSKYNPDPPSREDAGLNIEGRLETDAGDLAVNMDGELMAFVSKIKFPDAPGADDDRRFRHYRYRPGGSGDYRYLIFSRISETLAGAEDRFEEDVMPKTKREGKRVVWLGVEYQGVNKDLAEAMDVKGPTNSGEKGLLVVYVYKDSPAAKLGIKKGDILLEVIPEGKIDQKKELRVDGHGGGYGRRRSPMPTWRDRRNYLTTLLTEIGKGKEVELKYVQDKQEKKAALTLELAPPDFETAEKYKDEITGLTVRNLTYEVRHFYKLKDDEKGVVIEKVEPGSPAEVERLIARLLVRKINDIEVSDVEHFEELIKEAQKQKRETLTVFIEFMGFTKFVELKPDWPVQVEE